MKLIDNWRAVVSKSWALWLSLLSATLSAIEVWLPMANVLFPPKTFAIASGVVAVLAAVARVVYQASIHEEKK
jgi:hypothetical protein